MTFAGTHPPGSAVLALLRTESEIMEKHRVVAVRDSLRKEILSPGWFYHGVDGMPIDLKGLTARQTRNGFKLIDAEVMREILYLHVGDVGRGVDRQLGEAPCTERDQG